MNFNTLSIAAVVIIVLGFGYLGYRLLKQRLDEQNYQEQLAELEFQETLLADFGAGLTLGDDSRFVSNAESTGHQMPQRNDSQLGESSPTSHQTLQQAPHEEPSAEGIETENGMIPADLAAAAVIRQLQSGGLLMAVDGYLPLHGNTKGIARLRLRNRQQALLVPSMESEAFLRHHARRADLIIMVGADGKAVVVTPLEQLIAESISPS